jgi:two-component sensor histidine kinase
MNDDRVVVTWQENATDCPPSPPETSGFGTHLSQMTVEHQLGGTIIREWRETGLFVTITFGADQLEKLAHPA